MNKTMELKKALKVYRTRLDDNGNIIASWRRLDELMGGDGNQIIGMDLCIKAMERLQNMSEEEELLYGPIEHVEELR